MANTHQDWLQQLTAESLTKQETFMNYIADRMRRPRVIEEPNHPFKGAPDFWNEFQWPLEERIEKFTENFLSVGGHVEHMDGMEQVKSFIVRKAKEMSAKYIIRNNQMELESLELEGELPHVRISVWNNDPAKPFMLIASILSL